MRSVCSTYPRAQTACVQMRADTYLAVIRCSPRGSSCAPVSCEKAKKLCIHTHIHEIISCVARHAPLYATCNRSRCAGLCRIAGYLVCAYIYIMYILILLLLLLLLLMIIMIITQTIMIMLIIIVIIMMIIMIILIIITIWCS